MNRRYLGAAAAGLGVMLVFTAFGLRGWAGTPVVMVLAIAGGVVWYRFVSGRGPAATRGARARLWHWAFAAFFTVYVLGLLAWLAAGLVPALAHHIPGLHDRLHSYGGAPDVITVQASEVGPFSVEGSRRIREMTLRAGSLTYIAFTNVSVENGAVYPHNLSIRRPDGAAIFVGDIVTPRPPVLDERDEVVDGGEVSYTRAFTAPEQGSYEYRCDVHPDRMRGSVLVLPVDAHATAPATSQSTRDLVRRMAEVSHQAEDAPAVAVDYAFSAVVLGLGVFLYLLRPRERMARVFALAMVSTAAAYNLQSHAALATHTSFDDPLHAFLHPITGIMYIYALILFPDGRLVPRWNNRPLRIAYRLAVFIAIMVLLGATGSILPDFTQHPAALVLVVGMLIPFIGIVAQAYRIRRAGTSETRQQSRLLVWATATSFALGIGLLLALGIDLPSLISPDSGDPTFIGAAESRAFRVFQPLFVVIPIALFAGILRYRLWDIDLVINKTLVFGALAGFIGALYVGIVVGLGGALGGRTGLSIVATLLAAVAFDPLRSRVQRIANRVVYGDRASPYEIMADVSRRLGGATSLDDVLPAIAEAAGRALRAQRARAAILLPDGRHEASWPDDVSRDAPFDRTVPVVRRGEPVGEIAVGRRPGDPLRPADNRLLEALASQAGMALDGVRLADQLRVRLVELQETTRELTASRRRIVTARDAERSRLERQIHDRVERRLTAMAEDLGRAEAMMPRSRAPAISLLDEVAGAANEVQETLRDLARGIFPPLLADKGVVPALESQARKFGVAIEVAGDGLPGRFDARAEAAVYFCCLEALRAAADEVGPAGRVAVEVGTEDGWIRFAVRQAGRGEGHTSASDLQVLADRVEAVGGRLEIRLQSGEGWTISGRVPSQLPAAAQTSARRSGSNADFGT